CAGSVDGRSLSYSLISRRHRRVCGDEQDEEPSILRKPLGRYPPHIRSERLADDLRDDRVFLCFPGILEPALPGRYLLHLAHAILCLGRIFARHRTYPGDGARNCVPVWILGWSDRNGSSMATFFSRPPP